MCDECCRNINPNEVYSVRKAFQEGSFTRYKTCVHCNLAISWLTKRCGGYVTCLVYGDLSDHWQHEGIRTFELLRLIVGMRRYWQRFDEQGLMELK